MRKKYYIRPITLLSQMELHVSLLAGSGSSEAEAGGGPGGGGTGGGVSGGGGGITDAKQNPFSSWENWDEY